MFKQWWHAAVFGVIIACVFADALVEMRGSSSVDSKKKGMIVEYNNIE